MHDRALKPHTLTLLALCAGLALPAPAPAQIGGPAPAPEGAPADITLSQISGREWRVDYGLEGTATTLALARNPDASRPVRWRTLEDGFEIVQEDGVDRIRRTDGAPFTEAAFAVPADYIALPADYAPFSPFKDGGLLIHSGRFHACAARCAAAGGTRWPMRVDPPASARVLLQGAEIDGRAEWSDSGEGTMVYVGRARPIETEHLLAVVDDALPPEIRQSLDRLFPRLMDFYSEHLGPLPEKPMLFMSYDRDIAPDGDPESSSFHAQGGTLPGQVFMHLAGDGWAEADWRRVYGEDHFAWFFAHEAGHIYQRGAIYDDGSTADSWIHEGGAEAFAALALTALGAMSAEAIETRLGNAAIACAEGGADGPLSEALARGDTDLPYQCGMIVQLAADAAMRERSDGSRDLFDLWAAYIAALGNGAEPGAATFLPLMESMAGADATDFAREVAAGGAGLTLSVIRDGSARLGHPLPPYDN